jgi:hypothetical protein
MNGMIESHELFLKRIQQAPGLPGFSWYVIRFINWWPF